MQTSAATLKSLIDTLLNTLADGVITINEYGEIQSYNKICVKIFGYSAEEVLGENIDMLMLEPIDIVEISNNTRDVIGKRKDGFTFPMELSVGDTGEEGDHAFVWVIRDSTSRKEAENKERLLASIVLSLDDAIISRSNDGTITSWNKGAEKLFGYTAAEAVGQPYNFIIPKDGEEEELQRLKKISNGENILPAETIRIAKNGETFPILLSISPIRNARNEIIGSARIVRDIRVNKEAEKSRALLAAIVESSADGIISKTLEGFITSWNSGASKLFGYTAEEAIGQHISFLLPKERQEEENQIMEQVKQGSRVILDTIRTHKNGKNIHVSLTVSPIFDDEGKIMGVSKIAHDISERREAENAKEQLRQAQKMESLGQLTGGIAHDFNNLLAVIIGNLDFMMEQTAEGDELRDFIRPSMEAAEHGAELTKQLLAFGRKQALQPKIISLNELLHYFIALVRHTLGERIKVIVKPEPGLWNINVDPTQLQSALLNLAVNARDAMADGGKLIFETKNVTLDKEYAENNMDVTPGDYVQVAVSDSGAGMTQKVIEKAFEPFFTTKAVGKGTGLGLSMVYGFVKQSAGHIKIYSEVGHGTSIKIYLPRAEGAVNIAEQKKVKQFSTEQKEKLVLVVEDNKNVLKLTSAIVKSLGYSVLTAETGDEAIEILKKRTDIVFLLTDVMLPGVINGPSLAKQAVALYPHLKVLFNSGYAEHAIMQSGLLEEGVNLITKPFRKQQLANKMEEIFKGDSVH